MDESLTHSKSDVRRSLNLDIVGLFSNKIHRLCRRDLEGALSLYNCYCDQRTEESKHWHVRLKSGNQLKENYFCAKVEKLFI